MSFNPPVPGLRFWLRADSGVSSPALLWQDQSGNQHDATDLSVVGQSTPLPRLVSSEARPKLVALRFPRGSSFAIQTLDPAERLWAAIVSMRATSSHPSIGSCEGASSTISTIPSTCASAETFLRPAEEYLDLFEIVAVHAADEAARDWVLCYLRNKYLA